MTEPRVNLEELKARAKAHIEFPTETFWAIDRHVFLKEAPHTILALIAEVEASRAEIERLENSHSAEGTFTCTCNSYPHSPNCGLDARLGALRAENEALRKALECLLDSRAMSAWGFHNRYQMFKWEAWERATNALATPADATHEQVIGGREG